MDQAESGEAFSNTSDRLRDRLATRLYMIRDFSISRSSPTRPASTQATTNSCLEDLRGGPMWSEWVAILNAISITRQYRILLRIQHTFLETQILVNVHLLPTLAGTLPPLIRVVFFQPLASYKETSVLDHSTTMLFTHHSSL